MLVHARKTIEHVIPLSDVLNSNVPLWAPENSYSVSGMLINMVYDMWIATQLTESEQELYRYNWGGDMEIKDDLAVFTFWPECSDAADLRWACPVCLSEVGDTEDGIWCCARLEDGLPASDWCGTEDEMTQVYEWDDES